MQNLEKGKIAAARRALAFEHSNKGEPGIKAREIGQIANARSSSRYGMAILFLHPAASGRPRRGRRSSAQVHRRGEGSCSWRTALLE